MNAPPLPSRPVSSRPHWTIPVSREFTSLPNAQDGRLGRQAATHPWSALRVVKSCRKDRLTAEVLLEAKAAALHPERY